MKKDYNILIERKIKLQNYNKIHNIFKSPLLIIVLLLFLVIEVVFISLLMLLDILPTFFNIIILLLLVAATALNIKLMSCRKEKNIQVKIGTSISIIMIVVLGIGIMYLFNTYSMFNKVSDEDKQYEDYHVVVLKESKYKNVTDVNGETVFTYKNGSAVYSKAKNQLKETVDVKYKNVESCIDLSSVLIDSEKKKHDEIIFLSDNNYEFICEWVADFKEQTKIIYTISVEVDNGDIAKRVGITEESFNVYISGIDTFGGINKVSRSDVNMIMTVNPKTKEILLTSIPRDMYIPLHTYGANDKLTHSGIYGVDETIATIEDWLGIDINYYVRINFTSLVDIIDALGGVDVDSPYAFKSAVSKYEYHEGINHLDGKAALYFSRERKSFEDGDAERIKNQQRVLTAIIEKITESSAILTKYTDLLNAVEDEIQTNLERNDISQLVKMQLEDIGGWTIKTNSITGTGTYAATYSMGNRPLYVVLPDAKSVDKGKKEITNLFLTE